MDAVVADVNGGNAEVARDVSDLRVVEAPVPPQLLDTEQTQENTEEDIKMDEQEVNGDVKVVSLNKRNTTSMARRKLRKSKANSTSTIDSDPDITVKGKKRKLSEPNALISEDSMDFSGFDINKKVIAPGVEILHKLIAEAEALESKNAKRVRRSISKGPRRNIEFKTVDDHSSLLDVGEMKMRLDNAIDPLDIPKYKKDSDKSDIESDDAQKHGDTLTQSPSNSSSAIATHRQRGTSAGKQKGSVDMLNPIFREPFKYGWKREIVYNGRNENQLKKSIEVYYYAPKGKKVRSPREIAEFLNTKELTIDNFTFVKEPTGINDPEYEIIREEVNPPSVAPLNTRKMGSVGKRGGLARRIPGKMASPPSPVKGTGKWSPNKINTPTGLKVKIAGKRGPHKKLISSSKDMDVLSPMWNTTSAATRRNQTAEKIISSYKTKRCLKPKVQEPCSIRCSMSMGLIPSLQCRVCLCLYHPECVGHKEITFDREYICKNCRPTDELKKSITPPPLIPISMISAQNLKTNQLSSIERKTPPKIQQNSKSENITESPSKKSGLNPRVSSNALSMSNRTDISPPWFDRAGNKLLFGQDAIEPKPAQNIALLGGKRYIVVPKNNAMSVQPAIAARPDKLSNKSAVIEEECTTDSIASVVTTRKSEILPLPSQLLKNDENLQSTLKNMKEVDSVSMNGPANQDINGDITTADGTCASMVDAVTTVQQRDCKEINLDSSYIEDHRMCVELTTNMIGEMGCTEQSEKAADNIETSEQRSVDKHVGKGADVEVDANCKVTTAELKKPAPVAEIDQRQYFMDTVCAGYNALSRIFQYLKVQELLRASRVCKMWRDIAAHPALWKTVRMKNSQVTDWNGLAASLQRHGTQHLDLRKMLIAGESDDIWGSFISAIPTVTSLIKLELCRCPVMVVEKVIKACPQLQVLCAMSMKCDWLNLESIDKLEKCQELRLKAISGMSLYADLTPLSQLTQLTHLSLTSVKELGKKKIDVLGSLINLETLELGECSDFPAKFGTSVMCKLTKLERLRLEKGQGTCCTFDILNGVAKLEKLHQLELVNFDVKNGFDKRLANCKNIKRLLIIPTYISQSATSNNMVLGGVTELSNNLTHFVWGVTLELLRVTELFVDQCNQMNKQVSGDSIPVLKPVPCLKLIEDSNAEDTSTKAEEKQMNLTNPQVDILPLPQLQKLLLTALPKTRVKILKIPFHATWRQSISDTSSQ